MHVNSLARDNFEIQKKQTGRSISIFGLIIWKDREKAILAVIFSIYYEKWGHAGFVLRLVF